MWEDFILAKCAIKEPSEICKAFLKQEGQLCACCFPLLLPGNSGEGYSVHNFKTLRAALANSEYSRRMNSYHDINYLISKLNYI